MQMTRDSEFLPHPKRGQTARTTEAPDQKILGREAKTTAGIARARVTDPHDEEKAADRATDMTGLATAMTAGEN
jgi:hypothetical protein